MNVNRLPLVWKLSLPLVIAALAICLVAAIGMKAIVWGTAELSDMGTEDMPMATLAAHIDGNLMDEAMVLQKALRASYAIRAEEPTAKQSLVALTGEFDRLV